MKTFSHAFLFLLSFGLLSSFPVAVQAEVDQGLLVNISLMTIDSNTGIAEAKIHIQAPKSSSLVPARFEQDISIYLTNLKGDFYTIVIKKGDAFSNNRAEIPINVAGNFPLDEISGNFAVAAFDKQEKPVTLEVTLVNDSSWSVSKINYSDPLNINFTGNRTVLNILLTSIYLTAMIIITVIAVTVIYSQARKKDIESESVIWLSAVFISFPILRSSMSNSPPLGALLDYILFFPCIGIIVILLITTTIFLIHRQWEESHTNKEPISIEDSE